MGRPIWTHQLPAQLIRIAQGNNLVRRYFHTDDPAINSIYLRSVSVSGVHADCPENQYCWSATTCNVHDFWPPPTPRPSNPPSHRYFPSIAPSGEPSAKPTAMPTASPLGESDPRNFMYCGTSWVRRFMISVWSASRHSCSQNFTANSSRMTRLFDAA